MDLTQTDITSSIGCQAAHRSEPGKPPERPNLKTLCNEIDNKSSKNELLTLFFLLSEPDF